jgi:hypothetical protein
MKRNNSCRIRLLIGQGDDMHRLVNAKPQDVSRMMGIAF